MTSTQRIFLLGAGYIGRNVLDELLAINYSVTVLVRQQEQAAILENAGAKTVLGSLSDLKLITDQASLHEITINTASCDDLPSVEAVLAGIRQRVRSGKPSIYIHTSGAGVLEDGATGMFKGSQIYRDDIPEDIHAIPTSSMHRNVDIPVVEAAREFGDQAKIVIVYPPLVYGLNSSHNRHSFALSSLVRFALKHGFVGYVGLGHNVWSVVHVKDLGRAYGTILAHVRESSPAEFLKNPYFFAENGSEVSMRDLAEKISEALYGLGKLPSARVQPFTESDYGDVLGPMTPVGLGCNSRSRAIRLTQLGWKAGEKDIWTSLKEEEVMSIVTSLESTSG